MLRGTRTVERHPAASGITTAIPLLMRHPIFFTLSRSATHTIATIAEQTTSNLPAIEH
jgi:hypothetical protein